MAGAKLSEADKAALKKLNEEDASLSAKFMNQLLAAAKDGALVVSDKADLAGLSDGRDRRGRRSREGAAARRQVAAPAQNTTQQPLLAVAAEPRDARAALSTRRGRGPSAATPTTRARRSAGSPRSAPRRRSCSAQPNFAAWRLQDQMAKTPEQRAAVPRRPRARRDGEGARRRPRTSRRSSTSSTAASSSQPWDWDFYAEQVRKAQVRPGRRRDQAVLRAEPRAAGRRVLRRAPALRPHVQGAPRPPGLPAGRARVRGVRQGRLAPRRCSTSTTSSATTRTAAPGWTSWCSSRSCSARSR